MIFGKSPMKPRGEIQRCTCGTGELTNVCNVHGLIPKAKEPEGLPEPAISKICKCPHTQPAEICPVCQKPSSEGKCRSNDRAAFSWFDRTLGKLTLNGLAVLLFDHREEFEKWLK